MLSRREQVVENGPGLRVEERSGCRGGLLWIRCATGSWGITLSSGHAFVNKHQPIRTRVEHRPRADVRSSWLGYDRIEGAL